MVDLSIDLAGIKSPNPFWLSSGPIANTGYQVMNAFEAGWGGVAWKTIGAKIINVSPRLGGVDYNRHKLVGLNNIELISDRSLEDNLREIAEVKKRFPKHAVVVSIMAEMNKEAWQDVARRSEDAGADGLEMNFSCPHGMHERGMGAAIGQDPEITEMVTSWVKSAVKIPILAKMTPNITDIRQPARAAKRGGADGIALINTISSIVGVDIDKFQPIPAVNGQGTHGGYCGPAVKPIALNMTATLAMDLELGLPLSAMGGIETWRDAVEFILMGATGIQVQTGVMHWGFRLVEDMIDGLTNYMEEKRFKCIEDMIGLAVPSLTDWGKLDLNYKVKSAIDRDNCVGCQVCYIACKDGGHDAIKLAEDTRVPSVDEEKCVGCRLCQLVCPIDNCVSMVRRDADKPRMSWEQYAASLS